MSAASLHPRAPHLAVSVWAPGPEVETFARMCAAVEAVGGRPTGLAQTAPRALRFVAPWSVEGEHGRTVELGERVGDLVAGRDEELRVLRAGYLVDDEPWVVTYQLGAEDETHPVAAVRYADVLGVPEDDRDDAQRARAGDLADATTDLLLEAAARTLPLYAAIDVEAELPTPRALAGGGYLGGVVFLGRALLDSSRALLPSLLDLWPTATEARWTTGVFVSDVPPFGGPHRDFSPSTGARREAAELLGAAALAALASLDRHPRER